jgi:uncharacterized protein
MTVSDQRPQRIIEFVMQAKDEAKAKYPDQAASLDYRWEHTLRVVQYGLELAKAENADEEIVIAACLLHDIAKLTNQSNDVGHGRAGAKMVRPLLNKLGYARADVDNICFAIARHVDGQAGFEHPQTIEAHVVSDADKIDRFSGYRILRALEEDIPKEYDDFISSVKNQLTRLDQEEKMAFVFTPNGKKAFNEQITLQRRYLQRLVADHKMTILIETEDTSLHESE